MRRQMYCAFLLNVTFAIKCTRFSNLMNMSILCLEAAFRVIRLSYFSYINVLYICKGTSRTLWITICTI